MYDVIVIGAGPAGITAALYTARADLKTLIIGVVKNSNAYKAHIIENYFGFREQVSGPKLMEEGLAQAQRFGVSYVEREVVDLKKNGHQDFTVTDAEREGYRCRAVIICSGLGFKPSGIKNEQQLIGRGVSFCVTCDGIFFRGKTVAVIGNTNYAADEALQLLTYTPHITILSHGKPFTFTPSIQKILNERKITREHTARIIAFEGSGRSEAEAMRGGLPQASKLAYLKFADGSSRACEGAFLALGIATASDFATKLGIERSGPQNAYLVADPRTGATTVPGAHAAGDCTGGNAQASKSSGEGCNAAISVIKELKGLKAFVDYT